MEKDNVVEFVEKMIKEKIFLPHQTSLIMAMASGKIKTVGWNNARAFYKTAQHDILVGARLLEMEEGKVLVLLHPKGQVRFKCIENTVLE